MVIDYCGVCGKRLKVHKKKLPKTIACSMVICEACLEDTDEDELFEAWVKDLKAGKNEKH